MGMFDDMFSSSRGAGVMGTLLALVVLVGFGSLYLFVFDESFQGGERSIQSVIKEQDAMLKSQESGLKHLKSSIEQSKERAILSEQVISIERQVKIRDERMVELTTQRDEATAAITTARNGWEQYKEQYRAAERKRAEGEEIGDVVTISGRAFKKVVIKTVEPLRISFRHEDGNSTMKFEDIPDALIDRFQMTKEAAKKEGEIEIRTAGLVDLDRAISDTKQEVAYQRQMLNEIESEYQAKEQETRSIGTRIAEYNGKINNLSSQISAQQNKGGLRRTTQYQAEIDNLNAKIQQERAKQAGFNAVQAAYQQARQEREQQIMTMENNLHTYAEKRLALIRKMEADKKKATP